MDSNMEKWAHWSHAEGSAAAQAYVGAGLSFHKSISVFFAAVCVHLYSIHRWITEVEMRQDDDE